MIVLSCTIRYHINIYVTFKRKYMLRLILFSLSALLFLPHMAQAQQALTPSAHQAALAQQALSQARAKNFSALEATLRQLGQIGRESCRDRVYQARAAVLLWMKND